MLCLWQTALPLQNESDAKSIHNTTNIHKTPERLAHKGTTHMQYFTTPRSIHEYKIQGNKGNTIDFSDYEHRKILLVNVASECGLTPQYAQLEELYRAAKDDIVIIGCPANNFGGQEPGTDEQIAEFCRISYEVSFPLTTKISVIGEDQHELYEFVTQKRLNGMQDSEVQWNFQKYVFNEAGRLTHVFGPRVEPMDAQVLDALGVQLDN